MIFFLVSFSHKTKHKKCLTKNSRKIRSKIRGKIHDENSKNSWNFRSATLISDVTQGLSGGAAGTPPTRPTPLAPTPPPGPDLDPIST